MSRIRKLDALEILDSRGRPTLKVRMELEGSGGIVCSASVPSGASTGHAEARELRDGDKQRYGGMGCRKSVEHVCGIIADALYGEDFHDQQQLDQRLLDLDGSADKSRLGANTILGCSLVFARAQALEARLPLHRHFAGMIGQNGADRLPRPTINLFSGGKHAGGQAAIQDVLIVPAADTMDRALAQSWEVWQAAARLIRDELGMRALTADEGGLAPAVDSDEQLLDLACRAIQAAGLEPGRDIFLALDVAASHFYQDSLYNLQGQALTSVGMVDLLQKWSRIFPLVSIEDGLAEDDWDYWPQLRQQVDHSCLILGDDLLCTTPARIQRAIQTHSANALLLKVNQVGSLSEALESLRLARQGGWQVTVSARSGETEDDWLADLAVGWRGDQIKIGSITQSERLSKYNRLLEIEKDCGFPLNPWPLK